MSENTDRSKPMSAHTTELLPCPFCGGHAEVCGYESCDCCGKAYNGQVMCQSRGCCASVDHFDTDEEAVAAWNRRTSHTPTSQEREPSA